MNGKVIKFGNSASISLCGPAQYCCRCRCKDDVRQSAIELFMNICYQWWILNKIFTWTEPTLFIYNRSFFNDQHNYMFWTVFIYLVWTKWWNSNLAIWNWVFFLNFDEIRLIPLRILILKVVESELELNRLENHLWIRKKFRLVLNFYNWVIGCY